MISRRNFLRLSGIGVAGISLKPFPKPPVVVPTVDDIVADLVAVQPMKGPDFLCFYFDCHYEAARLAEYTKESEE